MKHLLFSFLFLLSTTTLVCQEVVRGKVFDSETDGELKGATIKVKNTNIATTTDENGNFQIEVPSVENVEIKVSFVGYDSKTVLYTDEEPFLQIGLNPTYTELGTFVVTATRSKRDIYDVPVRTSVLDREGVEEIPALSADDYLWNIPGVNIGRSAAFLSRAHISLRGTGSESGRTLAMLDGVPINKSDGGSVNWNAINPDDIEQVEVLKGPGSSIHGGNAMGGVINFITPTPQESIEGSLSQSIGTFNTYNTQARVAGRQNSFFWSVNGRYRQSDGYITTPVMEIEEYTVASFLNEYGVNARAGYLINQNHMFELSGGYYDGKRGMGTDYTGYGFENEEFASSDGDYNRYAGFNGRVRYQGEFENNKNLDISLYGQTENYTRIRESLRNDRITRYDVESIRDDIGLLSSFTVPVENHIITTGIDVRHGAVDGADLYRTSPDRVFNLGKMNQIGLYLQDEWSIGNTPWSILANLRYDYANFYAGAFLIEDPTGETDFLQDYTGDLDESTFSALSPRFSFQYHKEDSYRVYASYSRGFRAPVLDDLCRTGPISGGMKLANPDLKPEYLDNIELGGDIVFGNRVTVAPSVFYSIGTDYHAYIATGDSLHMYGRNRPIRIKDNIGEVEKIGAELAINVNILEGLKWDIAFSYIDHKIKEFEVFDADEDEDLVGKQLVYQPKDIFNTSVTWRNRFVNARLSFSHKGEQYLDEVNSEELKLDSFNFVDLHLWREIYAGISASLKIHNVLDEEFVDSRATVAPGRMITFELKYLF